MGIRSLEFRGEHVFEAAALFCSQYRRQRSVTPVLPETYARPGKVVPLISGLSRRATGVAAFEGSNLVGYLIGLHVPEFMGPREGIYCPEWAHGATVKNRRETYRCMYSAAAEQWVAGGSLVHCMTHLANDTEASNTFSMMGFGITTVDAMMKSRPLSKSFPPGITIKSIGPGEVDDIVPLSMALEEHLAKSPSFVPRPKRRWRDYYTQFLSMKDRSIWVAYKKGRAVSYMKSEPSTEPGACQVVRDSRVLKISGAYTIPDLRGRGLATAVLSKMLMASRRIYPKCSVDFESANLLASDFWLKHSTPVCYTWARHVDERVQHA